MLAINWGYALLVTGIGMGTVFLLLIILIWIINLQTKITDRLEDQVKPQPSVTAPDASRTSSHSHGYAPVL